jgi:acetyl esterase/lipase
MHRLKHPLAAIAALVIAAAAVTVVLLGDEGKGSGLSLTGLRVAGATPDEPLLYPAFRPDLDSYVARCNEPELKLAIKAPDGVESEIGDTTIVGSGRASVPVEPGHDFAIAVSGDETRYRIRCLPQGFPDWDYERLRPGGDGLFMVTFPTSHWLIVFDQDGVPRWWYRSPQRTLGGQVTPRGTVLWSRSFGDGYGLNPRMAHEEHRLDGSLVRNIYAHGGVVIDAHEHYAFPDGSAYVDSYVPRYPVDLRRFGGPRRAAVVDAEIEHLDPEGNLIWSWTSLGRIPLSETDRWWETIFQIKKPGPEGLPIYDINHINTIEPWGDTLVTSYRHLDALYGIDRRSGDILWKMGGTPRPESIEVVGDRYPEPFGGQHDSRIWGENLLSVYDNSVRLGRPPRGVLYRLEPEKERATFIRQFTDPTIPVSKCCGSMRPFAGGWLIGWGDTEWVTAFDDRGRITFRARVPGASYRAVPVLPGQATLEELEAGLEAMEDGPEGQERAAEEEEPAEQPSQLPTGDAGPDSPPVVLLIHGGSWLRGGPPAMDIPARIARDLGLEPVSIGYPLGDIVAANRTARRVAKAWRDAGYDVVAFGESAGGQMATLLAAEGRVDYAVGNAPVSNLLRYWEGDEQEFWEEDLGADEATRRELSPALQPQNRPVLLLHSPKDPGVPFDLSVDYAREFDQVRLRRVGGCHILDCNDERGYHYHRNSRIGLAWLARMTGLTPGG